MNPKPSLYQCLVLHEVQDRRVRWSEGHWWVTGSFRDHRVTQQVHILERQGYIVVMRQFDGNAALIALTDKGRDVVARRPLVDLLDQLNRK